MITIENLEDIMQIPDVGPEFFISVIPELIKNECLKCGDITIIFCSDDYLLNMNKTYLNHDYYTDIITFDYTENQLVSGDLFVSIDRIKENALLEKVPVKEELIRVVFHGVLHLIGFNDKTESEKEIMRSKENQYLSCFVSRETKC